MSLLQWRYSVPETPRARSAVEVLTEIERRHPEFAHGKRHTSAAIGAAYAARLVKEMREAASLTQEQLALGIGQSQSSISDIERARGKLGPSFNLLCAIANRCGMSIIFRKKDTEAKDEDTPALVGDDAAESDELYREAVAIVLNKGKASTSFVQRRLQIGYNRASRLVERMESEGLVSKADRVGRREVLAGDRAAV